MRITWLQIKKDGQFYLLVSLIALGMGGVSFLLLKGLAWASAYRGTHQFLLYFLPLVGMLTAFVYQKYGKGAQKGNNLIIESTQKELLVPLRMSFFTFIFTLLTHLFGGSAGREGSAVQIGGVLANKLADFFKLAKAPRTQLIHAGISAGFAGIFGTPLAGAFFGMEMAYIGGLEKNSLISCFYAAYLGNFISLQLGTVHESHSMSIPLFSLKILLVVMLAAVLFGIFGYLFAWWTHTLKKFYAAKIKHYLWRALIASSLFVVFILIFQAQKFEGLSLPLIDQAFSGKVSLFDPILKLFYTGLTLGAGFQGGEVTPLFAIGASLGGALGNIFQVTPAFLAALGLISVFGCAANAPITTIMLGIDLFGTQGIPYYILATLISYSVSGHQSIYTSQTILRAKRFSLKHHEGYRISELKDLEEEK